MRIPRKRLELAVLAFGALFVVVLVLSFRPGRRPSGGAEAVDKTAPVPPPAEAGPATTVLSGVDFTETLRGKPLFRIRSERTVGFGLDAGLLPNWYALEKVTLTLYNEEGGPVTVHAARAEYDDRTKAARLKGNVRWTDESGALGETETVEFDPRARALTIPGPIHFSRGTFDLRAASGRYDVASRTVMLAGPIQGTGTGEETGGLSALSAESALYRRSEGSIELQGNVSAVSRDGDRILSERFLLKTTDEGRRLEWARASGNVRGNLSAAAPVHAGGGGPSRTYAGDQAAFFFAPDGKIASLDLIGSPASVEEPGRRITARAFEVAFSGGRASSAAARGDVLLRSEQGESRSERASLSFGAAGAVETLELTGNVRLSGEGRSGRAEKAVELPARGVWLLTGEGKSAASVESGGSRVSAARIELSRNPQGLEAEGGARAVFTPQPGKKAPPAPVGNPSRPTHGKAERMAFDDASRVATLSGGASLWQEKSSLFGDDITLNDAERSVVAVGNVRAVLLPAPAPEASRAHEPAPAVVTARRMIYRESEGTALFEGGVGVTRGSWRASAERGTAFLGADRRIDRVELSGTVTLADTATGRRGSADSATDYPREGKTVLVGTPARVADAEGNRVAGARLTITERGKSVEVTAPEGGKTETIHRTRGR